MVPRENDLEGTARVAEKWYFKSKEEGLARLLGKGVTTHIFCGERVMLSFVELMPHSVSALHSHPEEQWGYLLEGECTRIQNGIEVAMKVGDFWFTPAHAVHAVQTDASGALILDVFSPPRHPYKKPGEGLGQERDSE